MGGVLARLDHPEEDDPEQNFPQGQDPTLDAQGGQNLKG